MAANSFAARHDSDERILFGTGPAYTFILHPLLYYFSAV